MHSFGKCSYVCSIMRSASVPFDIACEIYVFKKKFESIEKFKDEMIKDEEFLCVNYRSKTQTHEQLIESLVWKFTHMWIIYPEIILDPFFWSWMVEKEEKYDMEAVRKYWEKCRLLKKRKVIDVSLILRPCKKRKLNN